jgi:hypothetical protein
MTYDRTQFRAKKATVAESCSGTAGCTYLALEDYAHAKQYEDDPTRNCAASFFDVRLFSFSFSSLSFFLDI